MKKVICKMSFLDKYMYKAVSGLPGSSSLDGFTRHEQTEGGDGRSL